MRQTLIDIMIISGRGHAGHFLELPGSGSQWDISFIYIFSDGGTFGSLPRSGIMVDGEKTNNR